MGTPYAPDTWQARSKQERSEKCETAREGVCFWRAERVGRPSHHLSRRSPEPQSAACVCAMGAKPSALARAENELLRSGVQWYSWYTQKANNSSEKTTNGLEKAKALSFTARDVPIGEEQLIHTVEYSKADESNTDKDGLPIVCMHGFGTGVGIYYAALPALADRWAGKVFAIDTLGCALSSRPRWRLGHGSSCKVSDAEDFFVDGLERWRAAMKIEKMVLMGHSLGGYLAVAYAEKYAERVDRLVLVSAVGTPPPPPELAEKHANAPLAFRMVLSAWANGWSPFTVAKLGLGDTMMTRYVSMRFSEASWVKKPELKSYLLGSWTDGPNSAGGYAHATLLQPGGVGELAYARTPMGASRIPSLKVRRLSAIYGERDWMDWRNMAAVRKQMERDAISGPQIEILHVADANHNVQVDNPLGFVDAVMATCDGEDGVRDDARRDGLRSGANKKGGADGQMFGRRYYAEDRAREEAEEPASPRI